MNPGEHLDTLRNTDRERWIVTTLLIALGIGLGWVHWFGVFVGSALVALCQQTVWRGIGAGIGFGVLFVGVFLAWLTMTGDISLFLSMSRLSIVAVGGVLCAALFGSFVRGVR